MYLFKTETFHTYHLKVEVEDLNDSLSKALKTASKLRKISQNMKSSLAAELKQ